MSGMLYAEQTLLLPRLLFPLTSEKSSFSFVVGSRGLLRLMTRGSGHVSWEIIDNESELAASGPLFCLPSCLK